MLDIRQPDGTWATTIFYAGFVGDPGHVQAYACNQDDHRWADLGEPAGPTGQQVQPQRCSACGWMRARYLFNPHPEADDDAEVCDP